MFCFKNAGMKCISKSAFYSFSALTMEKRLELMNCLLKMLNTSNIIHL